MFETHLKQQFPTQPRIQYEVPDLYVFLDGLGRERMEGSKRDSFSTTTPPLSPAADISCLVFDPATVSYKPHDKDWIKTKVRSGKSIPRLIHTSRPFDLQKVYNLLLKQSS